MEHRPIYSSAFKLMLRRIFFEEYGKTPNSQAIQDACGVLAGMALFKGRDLPTFTRVGEADGKIFLDLANSDWEMVEIDDIPVITSDRFIQALREAGGDLEAVLRKLNKNTEDEQCPDVQLTEFKFDLGNYNFVIPQIASAPRTDG